MSQTPASKSLSGTHVALDLETTGLRYEQDRIIEVGAVKFRGKERVDDFHALVNPYQPLPPFIKRLTGITQAEVDKAPPFAAVAGDLEEFIGEAPVVGQNIAFDLGFLTSNGIDLSNVAYDTWDLATILLPNVRNYTLGNLARELKVEHNQAHRALADAEVTWKVFVALLERLGRLDPDLLAVLASLAQRSQSSLRHLLSGPGLGVDAYMRSRLGLLGFDPSELAQRMKPWQGAPVSIPAVSSDGEQVAALLSPDGAIGRHFPGYEHRTQQVEMAQAVTGALEEGSHLIVEGGTGIGKSVAYLLPAILFSMSTGKRVVVSTNTINLQEQILGKDIPALMGALEKGSVVPSGELRAATLKGRANYLCLRRLQTMLRSDILTNGEMRVLGKAFVWLQDTATGDREEINLGGRDAPVWQAISAGDRDYCHGNRHSPCFLRAARERAESAHVLVVNHALLLADVARGGALLPKYDHLIVDEAQHLEEVATRQLGFQAGQRLLTEGVQQMSRLLGPMHALLASSATSQGLRDRGEVALSHLEGLLPRLRDVWAALWAGIHDFVARHREESGDRFQMRVTSSTRTQPAWSHVEVAWENIDKVLGEVIQHGYDLLGVLEDVESPDEQGEGEFALELSPWLDGLSELKGRLRQLLVAPESDQIYWVDQEESGYLTLHAAPENVGPTLEKMLFAKKKSVVLTSATLTVGGEFAHMRQRLGFAEGDELLVGSPFDYRRAALVLVPEDMPEPFNPGYPDGLGKAVIQVAEAMEGRTLVLFTSHSALRGAARRVRGTLEAADIKVLAQGVDGTARQLAGQFADEPRAVLLGTSSFWEGVDLPGDMLRALVLARLPFNVPTEPVFAARSEQYENPFREYAVPQAVLRFRQGFGRLIRGEGDKGVVVILDRRVVSRNYGSLFLKSLPPCAIKRVSIASLAQHVQGWFGG